MRVAYCRPGAEPWPAPGGPPAGWEVVPCADCGEVEARARQGERPIDAVLAWLPPDAGRLPEMLSHIRASSPGLPIVVVGPAEREREAAAAVAGGAADYWLAGMSPLRLRTTLELAAAARRARGAERVRGEALERIADAVVATDAEERVACWNRAAGALFGYAYAEAVGRPLPELLDPVWPDARERREAWRAVAARGVWLGEATLTRRDGSAARASLELASARDGAGRRAGFLLVARPAGGAPPAGVPRDRREFLERILNAVADPIFVKDRSHRMVLVNDALCALVGRRREEVLGRTDFELASKEQAEVFHRQDELVFETGRENVNEELLTDAKGVTHVLMTKKTLWRDADGRPILVGVARDVTEFVKAVDDLKRSQEQLRHAQKLEVVGRLAGGVAHDFNNVLTAIVGCAGVLLETLPPGHPCREEAEEIRRAGEQASSLARQLLAFSRQEAGLPRVVDLREVFGGMRKMLGRLLPADIDLEMSIPDRLSAVRVDPGQAEQVLLNLVVNAGDAMPGGGRIAAELADAPEGGGGLPGPCVRLTVTDCGIGMDESTRARIFEPFFTTKPQGTGLGLATVRDVVAQSGGAVVVESAPQKGSSFHVFWPAASEKPEAYGARAEAAARPAPRRARVLVVEDDDAVRRFAVRSLERAGYEVLTAADGSEALRLSDAHEGLFDVVVVDVVLPRVRGTEVVARLRARQPTAQVLFMSGYRTDVASLPGSAAGRPSFLAKPFTAAALAEKVRELVSA